MKKVILSVAVIALIILFVEGGLSEVRAAGPILHQRTVKPALSTPEALQKPKILSKAQIEKVQKENRNYLTEKLSAIKRLTNAEKDELINAFIVKWPDGVNLKDKPHAGTVTFLQRLADHPKFKMEQKLKILSDYLDRMKNNMGRPPLKAKPKVKK